MKVAVWNIDKWRPSKFSDGENLKIVFKSLDDNKTYYLNLDTTHGQVDKWIPYMIKGTVLDVNLQPNNKNINQFSQFNIIKEVKKEET